MTSKGPLKGQIIPYILYLVDLFVFCSMFRVVGLLARELGADRAHAQGTRLPEFGTTRTKNISQSKYIVFCFRFVGFLVSGYRVPVVDSVGDP